MPSSTGCVSISIYFDVGVTPLILLPMCYANFVRFSPAQAESGQQRNCSAISQQNVGPRGMTHFVM